MERRLKILRVREQTILECLQPTPGRFCIKFPTIPGDTHIHHVSFDFARDMFMLFLFNEIFEPVPQGEMIPVIETEYVWHQSEIELPQQDTPPTLEESWRDRDQLL